MHEAEREARSQRFIKHVASNLKTLASAAREQFDAFGPGALVLRFDLLKGDGSDPVAKSSGGGDDPSIPMGYATRQWAERGNDSNLVGLIETYNSKSEILVFAAYPDGTSDVGKFEIPSEAPGASWQV